MTSRLTPRELAYSGLFGAAALLLPTLFHLVHLGHIFMPMYLPLVALAFFVGPRVAAVTAGIVPLLSGAITGMPPFYPPVAPCTSFELATMAAVIAAAKLRWPNANEWLLLGPVLLLGRVLNVGLVYGCSLLMKLPAAYLAGLSFISGWPGLLLTLAVVPGLVRGRRHHLVSSIKTEGH